VAIDTGYQGTGEKGAMDHAKNVVEEARAFKEAVASQAQSISQSVDLRGRVQRHPIGMVAAALGVGYLLGGGLFSPFTAKLVRYGLRLAVIPLVKSQLAGIVGSMPQAGEGSAGSTF
jgi:hypothetical protein